MQSAWTPFTERTSSGGSDSNNNWMMGVMQPWSWMRVSPTDMADIYARGISAMVDSVAACTLMATNMMFAGIEASRATTNYARHNSREIARITTNTARIFVQNAKEMASRMQEGSYGGTTTGTAAATAIGRTEEKETDTTRRK
jgi:hypothetical protein